MENDANILYDSRTLCALLKVLCSILLSHELTARFMSIAAYIARTFANNNNKTRPFFPLIGKE